jgi:hypothetical protein
MMRSLSLSPLLDTLQEIYHFEKVFLDRFEQILRELGERDWEKRDLLYYYKVS